MTAKFPMGRISKFASVGVFVMGFGAVLMIVLVEFLKINESLAYVIQSICAVELNFFLNNLISWRDRKDPLLSSWLKFHVLKIVTVGLTQLLFLALNPIFHYLVVYVVNVGIISVINYFGNDRFVFSKKED